MKFHRGASFEKMKIRATLFVDLLGLKSAMNFCSFGSIWKNEYFVACFDDA